MNNLLAICISVTSIISDARTKMMIFKSKLRTYSGKNEQRDIDSYLLE